MKPHIHFSDRTKKPSRSALRNGLSRAAAGRHRRLAFEPLETRRLLADLALTNLRLVSGGDGFTSAPTPVIGEGICVQATWNFFNMPGTTYRVEITVDGVPLSSSGPSFGTNFGAYSTECGWYASPGPHSVQV